MVQQLLWIETLLKLGGGLALVVAPLAATRLIGLPVTDTGFWQRVVGALLIGIAAATFVEGRGMGLQGHRLVGLGLAGLLGLNLMAAGVLLSLVVLRVAAPTQRGTFALLVLLVILALLIGLELAYA